MAKRFNTCIVPEASHRLHSLRTSGRLLHAFGVIGVISFLVSVALGFSYVRMAFKVADFNKLQAENNELKIETKNLERSAQELGSKVTDLETASEKLTKIMKDVFARPFAKPNIAAAAESRENRATPTFSSDSLQNNVALLRDRTDDLQSQFKLLEEVSEKREVVIRQTPTIWPLEGPIVSQFGSRPDPYTGDAEMHTGLDIVGNYGSAVKAPADGEVIYADRKSDYGNLIILDHGNGLTTRYGHLNQFNVHVGQRIQKGEVIARVGMTGRATAPHLHYEVRQDDRPVNPELYLPRGSGGRKIPSND
jgi:murein DD-endopeptidase MepM/ murein hydrolase activator NlpD